MYRSIIIILLAIIPFIVCANNNCSTATLVNFTQCKPGLINAMHTFNGPLPSCKLSNNVGSSWHYFYAPVHGKIQIESNAAFNDVMTLFKGNCDELEQIQCTNKDEYGFYGERINLELIPSTKYYVRISSHQNDFGLHEGNYCLQLSEGFFKETIPENNHCSNPLEIKVDDEDQCSSNFNTNTWLANKNASIQTLPSRNLKSRSSVWYYFTPYKTDRYLINSNAWFADVLTLYKGNCNALKEIISDTDQQLLTTPVLNAHETYRLQVSGYYAALQSRLCPEVIRLSNTYVNTNCANATTLFISETFTKAKLNRAARPKISSCVPVNGVGAWFKFKNVFETECYVDVDANFPYNFVLWEGSCSDTVEKYCTSGNNSCYSVHHIKNLLPNTTYYLNILQDATFPITETAFSIRLLDASATSTAQPLQIEKHINCFTNGTGELQLTVSGGEAPYSFIGDTPNKILKNNEVSSTTVIDQRGCAVRLSNKIECPAFEITCPIVSNLKANNITATSTILTYTSANYLQHYVVKFKELTGNNWQELPTSTTYASLTNLKSCAFYEAKVLNICDEFYGGYSESIYFKTKGCHSCQAPEELFALNATSNAAFLNWDIVDGASYKVLYKATDEMEWNTHQTEFPFMILFNLLPCTTYNWHIASLCKEEEAVSEATRTHQFNTLNCKDAGDITKAVYVIYPNPVGDHLNIKIVAEEHLLKKHHIKIFNTNGQMVFSTVKKADQQYTTILIDNLKLPAGWYDVKITNARVTHHQKIIIQ